MGLVRKLGALAAAAILAGAAGAAGASVTINFDVAQGGYTPTPGTLHDISDEFASLGLKLRNANDHSTPGATLGKCTAGGSAPVQLYGFGNFFGLCGDIFPNIDFLFVDPNDTSATSYTTAFSILITDGSDVTLKAYDAFGALLATTATTGGGFNQRIGVSGVGQIARVNVRTGLSDATAYDDIIFDEVHTAAGGVPEPAAWALMIAGFGSVGATLRRRRAGLA